MRRLRRSWILFAVLLALASAFVACTLNPQPLPPGDGSEATGGDYDASASVDGGFTGPPGTGAADASVPADGRDGAPDDGGEEAGDGGGSDGGDAGDAAD